MKAPLALLALALTVPGFASESGKVEASISARNRYVLARGKVNISVSSLDLLQELHERYSGDFLWFRKGAKGYIVQDGALLDRAVRLFRPLETLKLDRRDLSERQRSVKREEEAVDREQEELDRAAEQADDDLDEAGEEDPPAAPDPDLSRRRFELEKQRRDVAARERALDVEEGALDEREDALQRKAEKALWDLVDDALRRGSARPAD